MRAQFVLGVLAMLVAMSLKAQTLDEVAQFAQSMCGDIPSGSLTRSTIEGKVQANKKELAKLANSPGETNASRTEEIYKGIPFEKLPQNIPTVSMCKTELLKLLVPVLTSTKNDDAGENASKAQNELLSQPLGSATTIEKIRSVYGVPSKVLPSDSKDGLTLSFYDGIGHKLLLVTKNDKNIGKFGIFKNKDSKFAISVPFLDSDAFTFSLSFLIQQCDELKPSEVDAKYLSFVTSACYFGRPGGYQNFYFGFDIGKIDCKISQYEWNGKKTFKTIDCKDKELKSLPDFVFISPDTSNDFVLARRVYAAAHWWEMTEF